MYKAISIFCKSLSRQVQHTLAKVYVVMMHYDSTVVDFDVIIGRLVVKAPTVLPTAVIARPFVEYLT